MYPCPTRGISRKLVPFLFAAVLAAGFPVAAQETADTLIAKPAKPAEGGGFERLFKIEGQPGEHAYRRVTAPQEALPALGLAEGASTKLRIFHFNDIHSKLFLPHRTRGDTRSFAQIVKKVRAARAAAGAGETVLFFSAGDDHTGEVYDELLGSDLKSFVMSLPYRAYSAAGLDAATLGNHEFDKGSALLARMIEADARFPLVSANITGSTVLGAAQVTPAVIGVAKGLRIGLVGLTTPEETKLGFAEDPKLGFSKALTALKNLMPALVEQVDVVLVLSHIGFNGQDASGARHVLPEGDLDIARYLATLGKPAAVIGAHTHSLLNAKGLDPANVVDGVPVFQAGSWASHLGEIELTVSRQNGRVAFASVATQVHPLKRRDIRVPATAENFRSFEQDDDVDLAFQSDVIAPLVAKMDDRLAVVIGKSDAAPEIGADATIADRYVGKSAIANFMNDAVLARSGTFPGGKVDLVAFNASAIITGVPLNATLTFRDWYAVMPYADIIRVTEMTGQQIKDMVTSNAQRLVRPGETVDLKGFVSRGMLHFSKGLRYKVRLGADPASATAEAIELLGQPIDQVLTKTFRVAFGDYVANGNEGWRGGPVGAGLPEQVTGFNLRGLPNKDTGLVYRNEILQHIAAAGGVTAAAGAKKDGRLTVTP